MKPSSEAPPGTSARARQEAALTAFTRRAEGPQTTLSLVLAAVTVASVAMAIDRVHVYSEQAFVAGTLITVVGALVVARTIEALRGSRSLGLAAALLLPTAFGALIGTIVQAMLLSAVGNQGAIKDLGGLIDTTEPSSWIAGGVILGGVPALFVSAFVLLAGRAIRRLGGHDAAEDFGVMYTGAIGVFASMTLVVVDGIVLAPLCIVATLSALTLLVSLLVDGARLRFLRGVFNAPGGEFDIVPAEKVGLRGALAPVISGGGSAAVLVRNVSDVSYRVAAAEPIALIGPTEFEALRPLVRRRAIAGVMLATTSLLVGGVVLVRASGF